LSWRFVEQPFRQRPYRIGRTGILSMSAIAMGTLVVFGLAAYPVSERLWVIPEKAQRILAMQQRPAEDDERCFLHANGNDLERFDRERCLGHSTIKPNVLLIGDSMAADISHALRLTYPDVNWLQAMATRCKPVLAGKGANGCNDLMNFIFREFIPTHKLDAIVISARWTDDDISRLVATVLDVKQHADKVVIIGPRLEYESPLPRLLVMSIIGGDPGRVDRARKAGQKERDAMFAERLNGTGATYFSAYQALCPPTGCIASDGDGMPINSDYGHFTALGAMYVIQMLKSSGVL
jgi:hypothetical protein